MQVAWSTFDGPRSDAGMGDFSFVGLDIIPGPWTSPLFLYMYSTGWRRCNILART